MAFGSADNAREAYDIAARIIEIAPEHPCVWTWEIFQGVACLNLARYEEAVELFRRVVEASPKFVRGIMCRANGLGACGKPDDAREVVARAVAVNANFTAERFAGHVRVLSGNEEAARRLLYGLIKAGLIKASTTSGLQAIAGAEYPPHQAETQREEAGDEGQADFNRDIGATVETPAKAADEIHHRIEQRKLLPGRWQHGDGIKRPAEKSQRRHY